MSFLRLRGGYLIPLSFEKDVRIIRLAFNIQTGGGFYNYAPPRIGRFGLTNDFPAAEYMIFLGLETKFQYIKRY